MSDGQLEDIIYMLHGSSDEKRRKAAEAFRQHGEPGGQISVEMLIDILRKDTIPLRVAAAGILREWRQYVPIDPLFLALQDKDEQVRTATKWVLAEVGEYALEDDLLPHLADKDTIVRAAVLLALGTRAPVTSILEAIRSPEEELREAGITLVALLKEQVPVEPLINMLQTEDVSIRAAATKTLGYSGKGMPIASLINALHDMEIDVRLEAIKALANSGERIPETELYALLDDNDQHVRQEAVKALVRAGNPTAIAIIVNKLHTENEWAREEVLSSLLSSDDIEIREIACHLPQDELLHLLKDEWWPVGYMVARLLAVLEEKIPLAEVLALISHPLPQARQAALYTLAELSQYLPLSEFVSIEPVLMALEAEDVETRREAARVLDAFGPLVPVDQLLPFLEKEDIQVAHTLAKRGRQEGSDVLVANLWTIDNAWSAAVALGETGKQAPVGPLLTALNASDWTVRQAVAEALYKTRPDLLPQLVPELVETLCSGKVGPLLEPLQDVLITKALTALSSSEPDLLAWIDQSLESPHWEVRLWAILGLLRMRPVVSKITLARVQDLLNDPSANIRNAASRILQFYHV